MRNHSRGRSRQQGSLLVITLWIITLLSVFAVAVARHLSLELRLSKYHLARERARTLAHSGIALAIQQLARDAQDADKPYDWLGDGWALVHDPIEADGGAVRILAVTDEERKLDVNAATSAQLQALGVPGDLAQAVVDYRDPEDATELRSAEPPYQPKDGAIVRLEELRDIPSATPEAFDALQAQTTPYSGDRGALPLNINTASADVLRSLAGETLGGMPAASVIDALVAARAGSDGDYGTADDCIVTALESAASQLAACTQMDPAPFVELLSKAAFTTSSSTFRIQAEGVMEQPAVRYRVEAVVRRTGEADQPLEVLSWKEGASS